jgi:hypothetical protein
LWYRVRLFWSKLTLVRSGWVLKNTASEPTPALSCDMFQLYDSLVGIMRSATTSSGVGGWPPLEVLGKWSPFDLSLTFSPTRTPCSWSRGDAAMFSVRSSEYLDTKLKVPSEYSLYDCVGLDAVRSETSVVRDLCDRAEVQRIFQGGSAPWPWTGAPSDWNPSLGLPRVIIVNWQVPLAEPVLFGAQPLDPGVSIISYCVMSPSLCETLSSGSRLLPSVGLLRTLLERGESSSNGTSLKLIALVENFSDLNLPQSLSKYGGKPVLLTKSCSIRVYSSEVVVVSVDLRSWSYVARKTMHTVLDKTRDADLHFALVVEGNRTEDLPEQVLLCFRVNKLGVKDIRLIP